MQDIDCAQNYLTLNQRTWESMISSDILLARKQQAMSI